MFFLSSHCHSFRLLACLKPILYTCYRKFLELNATRLANACENLGSDRETWRYSELINREKVIVNHQFVAHTSKPIFRSFRPNVR